MSERWLKGNKRIERYCARSLDGARMAYQIRKAIDNGEIEVILSKIDIYGNVTIVELDKNGEEKNQWI